MAEIYCEDETGKPHKTDAYTRNNILNETVCDAEDIEERHFNILSITQVESFTKGIIRLRRYMPVAAG